MSDIAERVRLKLKEAPPVQPYNDIALLLFEYDRLLAEMDRLREWMERGGVALDVGQSPVDAVIEESRLYFALSEAARAELTALREAQQGRWK